MVQIIVHGQYRNNKTTCVGSFSNNNYIEKFRRDLFMKRVDTFKELLPKFKTVTIEIKKDLNVIKLVNLNNTSLGYALGLLNIIVSEQMKYYERLELNHIARIVEDIKEQGRFVNEQTFDTSFSEKISSDLIHSRVKHKELYINDSMTVKGLSRVIVNCSQEIVIINPKKEVKK